ncbi:hypothetical protein HPB51_004689 [Rhipicephalus microplus]|uniref:Uncharacterized protein n=1 Tax=Rhipicephalus microplus TaxID=6941 RepID=A0A9J6DZN8_RHIMP|nr:hypothetical protein HPB51_004689 [Rhipicephalus microplus]
MFSPPPPPPRDVIWTIDTQPDWLPGAHLSDYAATETPGNSVAVGVEPQPPTDSGLLVNLNAAAATTTKPPIFESHQPLMDIGEKSEAQASIATPGPSGHAAGIQWEPVHEQPSDAPAHKAAFITNHTKTQSSNSDTAVGYACSRTVTMGHSSSMSEGNRPRKSSMTQRRSMDSWSARNMEDQAPPASGCPKLLKDSGGVGATTTDDRALYSTRNSPADNDNTASSAVRTAHKTAKGLQRWSSFRHLPATSDDLSAPPPSRDHAHRRANWTAGVTKRPLNMMRLCLEGATSKADAVREYVSFVNGRSFAWPTSDWNKTAVVQPRLPLRALLDLAVKWGLPLWFRVDLACSHREDRIGIVISPSPFPAAFHYLHSRFLRYADIYPFYVQAFLDVVFSHRPAAPVLETFVRDSSRMQGHVFAKMTSAAAAPYFAPRIVAVERLQSLVKNVSAEDWIAAF